MSAHRAVIQLLRHCARPERAHRGRYRAAAHVCLARTGHRVRSTRP
ncbi:hypothetical protein AB0O20_27045 [Streptomyces kronopolitis]